MVTQGYFDLKGMGEYLEEIAKAGVDIDSAAQRALVKGADILQVEMQSLVPIGDAAHGDPHPGNLLAHIKIKGPLQDGNFNYVEVGVINDIDFTDAETAIYGNVQEYGSATNKAQPYIRPAIDNKRRAVMAAMKESLKGEGLM
jgi:HK97 gp10 family phage protein